MSIKVMTQVWEADLPAEQKYVLLKMADHANDEGGDVYPSVARVAHLTGLSERTVQRRLKEMTAAGVLEVVEEGGGRKPTEYRIRGDRLTPLSESGVTTVRPSGDTGVTPAVTELCHPNRQITVKETSSPQILQGDSERRTRRAEGWLRKEMIARFGESVVKKALAKNDLHSLWRKAFDLVKADEAAGRKHPVLKDYLARAAFEDDAERRQMAHRDAVYARPMQYADPIEPHPLLRAAAGGA